MTAWILTDLPDTAYSPAVRLMVYLSGFGALFSLFALVGMLHLVFYMRRVYWKMHVLHDLQIETLEITRWQQERAVNAAAKVASALPAVELGMKENAEAIKEQVRGIPEETSTQVVERLASGPPSGIGRMPNNSPPS